MEETVVVPINETFTDLQAIQILQRLSCQRSNCGIYFNYSIIHPGVRH